MKTKLIQALREAARQLSDGSFPYYWFAPTQCNCGVLASCVVGRGLSSVEICDSTITGSWTAKARHIERCAMTGAPLNEVFAKLEESGLPANEWKSVEFCDNPRVLKRMGAKVGLFKQQQFVTRYFLAWADLLEEESRPATSTHDQIHAIEARDIVAQPLSAGAASREATQHDPSEPCAFGEDLAPAGLIGGKIK